MSEYQKLTVVKLKELLKDRGLTVAGKKADLIERLEENDAQTKSPGRQLPDAEANDAPNLSVTNGKEASPPPSKTNTAKEPVVAQVTELVPSSEEIPQESEEKVVEEASELAKISEPAITNDVPENVPPTEALPTDVQIPNGDQEGLEAVMDARDDVADAGGASESTQINEEIGPSAPSKQQAEDISDKMTKETTNGMEDRTMDEVTENQLDDARDSSTKTIKEMKQEARTSPMSDGQVMPAPELPASQIPRPSIETQQIQEPRNDSHTPDLNSGMEGITRTTTMSSVNTQELLEDRKKRKRRSHSPPISSTEVAIKKAKAIDGSPRATLVQDGQDILSAQDGAEMETEKSHDPDLPLVDEKAQNTEMPLENEDQSGAPSKHSPTKCLYISNLMRPLQPSALRAHLEKLASLGAADSTETIGLFFLESTRHYGITSFSSIAAATRARLGLHDRVWPDESNRKALFVDFIPESIANELIQMEEDNAKKPRLERKRFEILYLERDGKVVPEIHNADSPIAVQHRAGQAPSILTSTNQRKPSMPSTLPPPPREETGKNFKALDDLFPSTTAKPRLYYLPSSTEVAEKRLDTLSRATMREESRKPSSISEEKRRYTFEDGDIVDKGPEFGFGRGGNAARGRNGGFNERGNYRGRGRGGSRGDFRSGAGIGYHDRW